MESLIDAEEEGGERRQVEKTWGFEMYCCFEIKIFQHSSCFSFVCRNSVSLLSNTSKNDCYKLIMGKVSIIVSVTCEGGNSPVIVSSIWVCSCTGIYTIVCTCVSSLLSVKCSFTIQGCYQYVLVWVDLQNYPIHNSFLIKYTV